MGKTSLLARILQKARKSNFQVVLLSFQMADRRVFRELDEFLRWFCINIGRQLGIETRLENIWNNEIYGSKTVCTAYFEQYLLLETSSPLVLGLDEVDRVFEHMEIADDFFALLRAWYEKAKNEDIWKKLRLVVTHSTEVYIPLNINQSPFNVGLPVHLQEFSPEQVYHLAKLYEINWSIDDKVAQLMAMVGGHPYLVRLALYHIKSQGMTLDQLLEEAPTDAGIFGNHLRWHLWNLQQQPKLMSAFKNVLSETNPVRLESVPAFKLHSMGLVHLEGNNVRVSCDLYRQYFSITAGN